MTVIDEAKTYMNRFLIQALSHLSLRQYKNIIQKTPELAQPDFSKYFDTITKRNVYKILGKKGIPIDTNLNEITGYRFKAEYRNSFNETNKDYKQFASLLKVIEQYHSITSDFIYNLVPGLFLGKINFLEMRGTSFYYEKLRGRKSENLELMKEYLPFLTPIIPTLVNKADELYRLGIPKKLSEAFSVTEDTQYHLGLRSSGSYDTFFLFPKRSGEKEIIINSLAPEIIETSNDFFDGNIFNISIPDIVIYNKPIEVVIRSGDYAYLKLPQEFLIISDGDVIDLHPNDPAPILPTYVLMYDLFGNLIFDRIIYSSTNKDIEELNPNMFLSSLSELVNK